MDYLIYKVFVLIFKLWKCTLQVKRKPKITYDSYHKQHPVKWLFPQFNGGSLCHHNSFFCRYYDENSHSHREYVVYSYCNPKFFLNWHKKPPIFNKDCQVASSSLEYR